MIATSGFLTALECTKFNFGREHRPGPHWGSLQHSPTGLRGLLLRGGEEKGREVAGEGQGTGGIEGVRKDARERGGEGGRRGGGGKNIPSVNSCLRPDFYSSKTQNFSFLVTISTYDHFLSFFLPSNSFFHNQSKRSGPPPGPISSRAATDFLVIIFEFYLSVVFSIICYVISDSSRSAWIAYGFWQLSTCYLPYMCVLVSTCRCMPYCGK